MSTMQPLHEYYFLGTIATNIGSLIVIISYICTPELRHNHSVFIYYRCIIDLALGICLSSLFIIDQTTSAIPSTSATNPDTDSNVTSFYHPYCQYLGPLTQFLFISLIGYFLALIAGLHKSITNPFTSPAHFHITKTNLAIYLTAAVSTVIVKCTRDFYYNLDAQLCLINDAHIMYYYLPLTLTLLYGIYVAISTFYRLRKGLPNTFRVRKKMIRDVWSFCIIFVIYMSCLATTYSLTILPLTRNHQIYHYLYAITLSVFGVPDFVVFILINLDIYKRCIPCYCCCYDELAAVSHANMAEPSLLGSATVSSLTAFTKTDLLKPLHPKQLSLVDDFHITPNPKLLKQLTQEKQAKRSCLQKCWRRMGVSMRDDYQPKGLNDTLRREILAYTTNGIAQSVDKCDNEILSESAFPENISDFRPNVVNRFNVKIQNNWSLGRGQNVITMDLCGCCKRVPREEPIPITERQTTNTEDVFVDILKDEDDDELDEEDEEDLEELELNGNMHDDDEKLSAYFVGRGRTRKRASMPSSFSINAYDEETSQIAVRSKHKHVQTPSLYPKHRVFVDYAPLVFKHIRQNVLGIDDKQYKASIIPSTPRMQLRMLKKCKFGEGRSGAFFYITHDSKFVVKTIKKREVECFVEILSDYKEYLDANPRTIFSRCVGLHSLTFYGLTLYFLVMENVFAAKLKPTETYDLKGSWVGRYTEHGLLDGRTMKDLDLKRHVILSERNRESVLDQLTKDTLFLEQHNLMDYSLLLGIHYMKIVTIDNGEDDDVDDIKNSEELIPVTPTFVPLNAARNDPTRCRGDSRGETSSYLGGLRAQIVEGPGIYYIGIIDALQQYSWRKRLEAWIKTHIQRLNGDGISCVDPTKYRNRFMKYMRNVMISEQRYKQKLKLFGKQFTKQQVLVYPSSANINKNLNEIREERARNSKEQKRCSSFNRHKDRFEFKLRTNAGGNMGALSEY